MAEINEAYAVLSNPDKRRQYDKARTSKGQPENSYFEDENGDEQSGYDPLKDDWELVLKYYADVMEVDSIFPRYRVKLAYSYKIFMLETKAFENRLTQAVSMKNRYLKQYFGSNQAIIDFATYLLCSGHRSAAKELNRVVYVLGSKITPNDVIEQIEKEFKIGEIKDVHVGRG